MESCTSGSGRHRGKPCPVGSRTAGVLGRELGDREQQRRCPCRYPACAGPSRLTCSQSVTGCPRAAPFPVRLPQRPGSDEPLLPAAPASQGDSRRPLCPVAVTGCRVRAPARRFGRPLGRRALGQLKAQLFWGACRRGAVCHRVPARAPLLALWWFYSVLIPCPSCGPPPLGSVPRLHALSLATVAPQLPTAVQW